MFSLDRVSLTHGAVMVVIPLLAAAALAATVVRRGRRWWLVTLPAIVTATGAALAMAVWYLHDHVLRDHYPKSFLIWVGEALLTAAGAAAGWRQSGRWRRIVAVVGIPLSVASAFVLINAQYAYWPTLGDLLGRPLPNQMTAAALADVLARKGDLPTPPGTVAPAAPADAAAPGPAGTPGDDPATGSDPPPPTASAADGAAMPPTPSTTDGPHADPHTADPAPAAAQPAPAQTASVPARSAAVHRHLAPAAHRAPTIVATTPTMHGSLAPLDIPATASGFAARQGTLYLPPAFFTTPRPALPVIVMVGGTPGGPADWPRAGFAAQTADAYATQHGGLAPILAFVDHNGGPFTDTECVDGPAGRAETFLSTDVPHYLADTLHVPPDPQHWAIAGFSEGGTCAFELAVRHPDVYGAFIDIAGDWAPNMGSEADTLKNVYGGDRAAMAAHDPANLLTPNRFHALRAWFAGGTSDHNHVAAADRLVSAARPAGITTSRTLLPGGHNWQMAGSAFRVVLDAVMHDLAAGQSA